MIDVRVGVHDATRMSVSMGVAGSRIKEIPGSRFDRRAGTWTVPLSWPAAVEVGAVAARSRSAVVPDEEASRWVGAAKAQADMLRAMSTDLGTGTGDDRLFGHQRAGAAWLAADTPDFPGRLLLDETGSGKTRTVIEALGAVDRWPVLIVTLNAVKESWRREFETHRPDLDVVVVGGTATQRRKQLESGAQVLIVNYEAVRSHSRLVAYPGQSLRRCTGCGGSDESVTPARCQAHQKELNRQWSVVVADEVHRIKDPKSLQTQAMWGVSASAERRWALTGTIIANSPQDLWAPLRFVDPQAWPVRGTWVELYCVTGFNWFGAFEVRGLRPEMREVWDQWWLPMHRRVLKEQVLDLPPLLRGGTLVRRVPMSRQQEAAYHALRETMVAEVRGGTLTVQNALVKAGRLTSLASAHGAIGDDGEFVLSMPSAKIDAFISDWESGDFPGSTVVAMSSRQLLMLLSRELEARGHGPDHVCLHGMVSTDARTAAINRFQSGEVPLLLMTFATGGTGITLTRASQMVLMQRDWSAVAMKQGIDRVHRIGSEIHQSVSVVDYIAPNTIEEIQVSRLAEKEDLLEDIVRDSARLESFFRGEV